MDSLWQYPIVVFALSFAGLWLSARLGASILSRWKMTDDQRDDFGVVQGASLTLLGLIIGFSFSMATGRYDQRKNLEEEEANAIGTEYVRADLLPSSDGTKVRQLLKSYLDQRLLFYEARNAQRLREIDDATDRLQTELWVACVRPATANPTPLSALATSGMNDVLNSQGYTLAAWRNHIPTAAWLLMEAIAIGCNLLIGYGARHTRVKASDFIILPLVVSVSFFLIADLDSPRGGVIRVVPQNLAGLSQSLHRQP
jgi:hypothetical protein